jgi:uncharacterized protein YndB with AHSA1/START domain
MERIMPTTNVAHAQDSVAAEIYIAAPPQRVFQALTQSNELLLWWGDDKYHTDLWEMDARPGGQWHYRTKGCDGTAIKGTTDFKADGEILEIDPPRLLVYTWIADWHADPKRKTVVRWELTPSGDGTKVKVTHCGLAEETESRKGYGGGWTHVLELLKKFVEK